jgi:hypothetical protein
MTPEDEEFNRIERESGTRHEAILAALEDHKEYVRNNKRKVSEDGIRTTIGMMRSIASNIPISPFHLAAAKEMEIMLEELLALRKKLKEKAC